jgi:hypothetical protein
MAVYVDDMRRQAKVGRCRPNARWSHLMADTPEELAEFAGRLGLDPSWLQHPGTHREHYDVTDARRAEALRMGAQHISYPRGTGSVLSAKRARLGEVQR